MLGLAGSIDHGFGGLAPLSLPPPSSLILQLSDPTAVIVALVEIEAFSTTLGNVQVPLEPPTPVQSIVYEAGVYEMGVYE